MLGTWQIQHPTVHYDIPGQGEGAQLSGKSILYGQVHVSIYGSSRIGVPDLQAFISWATSALVLLGVATSAVDNIAL